MGNIDLDKYKKSKDQVDLLDEGQHFKKSGPKKKTEEEKAGQRVKLSFLPSEITRLKKKAGRVPLATFVKDILIKEGYI